MSIRKAIIISAAALLAAGCTSKTASVPASSAMPSETEFVEEAAPETDSEKAASPKKSAERSGKRNIKFPESSSVTEEDESIELHAESEGETGDRISLDTDDTGEYLTYYFSMSDDTELEKFDWSTVFIKDNEIPEVITLFDSGSLDDVRVAEETEEKNIGAYVVFETVSHDAEDSPVYEAIIITRDDKDLGRDNLYPMVYSPAGMSFVESALERLIIETK